VFDIYKPLVSRLLRDVKGQDLVEYALIHRVRGIGGGCCVSCDLLRRHPLSTVVSILDVALARTAGQ